MIFLHGIQVPDSTITPYELQGTGPNLLKSLNDGFRFPYEILKTPVRLRRNNQQLSYLRPDRADFDLKGFDSPLKRDNLILPYGCVEHDASNGFG